MENAACWFRGTGIWPIDRKIFSDVNFAVAEEDVLQKVR
jgi:hypothetical protein